MITFLKVNHLLHIFLVKYHHDYALDGFVHGSSFGLLKLLYLGCK